MVSTKLFSFKKKNLQDLQGFVCCAVPEGSDDDIQGEGKERRPGRRKLPGRRRWKEELPARREELPARRKELPARRQELPARRQELPAS